LTGGEEVAVSNGLVVVTGHGLAKRALLSRVGLRGLDPALESVVLGRL
jgi:hypothetical protein